MKNLPIFAARWFSYINYSVIDTCNTHFTHGEKHKYIYWSVTFCFLFLFFLKVIGSENFDEIDQGSQITRFIEGYKEGRTVEKKIGGPSLIGYINSLIGIRTVYIIVFVVAVMMIIQSINKEEPLTIGSGEDQTDQAWSSSLTDESREEYRPRDKED